MRTAWSPFASHSCRWGNGPPVPRQASRSLATALEAEKIGLIVNAQRTGEQLQDVIRNAYAAPPRVIERLQKLNAP